MKICLLGYNLAEDRKEGVRNLVFDLARHLRSEGMDVFIVTNGHSTKQVEIDGIRVVQVKSQTTVYSFIFGVFGFIRELENILLKEQPDVVHDHFVLPGTSLLITAQLSKKKSLEKIKFVKSIYNKSLNFEDIQYLLKPFNLRYFLFEGMIRIFLNNVFIDKLTFQNYHALICHSSGILKQVQSWKLKIPISKINLSVNARFFKQPQGQKIDFDIAYLGHPSFKKGLSFFLQVINRLLSDKTHIKIVVAISKTAEGVSYYEREIKRMQKLYPGSVSLLREVDPLKIYQSSKIMVFPLLHDWSAISPPLSVLEALVAGSSVLTTNKCGLEDIISDGVNGYIMQKIDRDLVCDRIQELLSYPNSRIGNNAVQSMNLYKWDKIIKKYVNLYNQIKI